MVRRTILLISDSKNYESSEQKHKTSNKRIIIKFRKWKLKECNKKKKEGFFSFP